MKSSTVKATGVTFNDSFGLTPGLDVVGEYFNDTLRIGNVTIPDMTGTAFHVCSRGKNGRVLPGNLILKFVTLENTY